MPKSFSIGSEDRAPIDEESQGDRYSESGSDQSENDYDPAEGSVSDGISTASQKQRSCAMNENGITWTLALLRQDEDGQRLRRVSAWKSHIPFNVGQATSDPINSKPTRAGDEGATVREGPVPEIIQRVFDATDNHRSNDLRGSDRSRHSLESVTETAGKANVPKKLLRIGWAMRIELVIRSRLLHNALMALKDYYPSHENSLIINQEPYPFLMHHYEQIQFACGDDVDSKAFDGYDARTKAKIQRHLKILRDFLEPDYVSDVMPCQVLVQQKPPVVAFDMIWYILRPGTDVYSDFGNDSYRVDVFYLGTDGWRMGRARNFVAIDRYPGEMELTRLPVCPTEIWDRSDGDERRARILKRSEIHLSAILKGSMFLKHSGRTHDGKVVVDHINGWRVAGFSRGALDMPEDRSKRFVEYDGIKLRRTPAERDFDALDTQLRDEERHGSDNVARWIDQTSRVNPAGRAVDVSQRKSSLDVRPPGSDRPVSDRNESIYVQSGEPVISLEDITEHQRLILNPAAPAFALASKKWIMVNFDQIEETMPSDESIDNLVMDKAVLQTIRALSIRQTRDAKTWNADFIEGKGAGQIILLHGPPGVGKTYTVESISNWLGRPLVALTVADIGTTETRIEQELMLWFDLAEAWNAVLLVDEADIFLEQRKTRDLSRNGLVSAFLRRMEYFRGLLFLTTNRVGQIDDAFMSRVHVAIGYGKLTPEVRKAIWKGFFDKLGRERAGKIKVGAGAKKYVLESDEATAIPLNGREIRNALQTAITLAEYETSETEGELHNEPVIVEESHFRQVLQMSEKFQKYVTAIRKEDEAKRAAARGDRNDYYTR